MRRLISGLALAGIALAAGQSTFTYSDKSGNVSVVAQQGAFLKLASGDMRLELRGSPVNASSRSQGIAMKAANVVAVIAQAAKGKSQLKSAVATGGVVTVKSATTPTGAKVTEIRSQTATYTAGTQESVVVLTGAVTIKNFDASKHQTLVATGSSGEARLEPTDSTRRSSGLLGATLAGPVRVVLNEKSNHGPSTVAANGDRMVLDNRPGSPTVTLTGNVRIQGQGQSSIGNFSHLSRAVLHLNAKGELVGFDSSAG